MTYPVADEHIDSGFLHAARRDRDIRGVIMSSGNVFLSIDGNALPLGSGDAAIRYVSELRTAIDELYLSLLAMRETTAPDPSAEDPEDCPTLDPGVLRAASPRRECAHG